MKWPFSCKAATASEISFTEGFSKGFELGLSMASQFDQKAKDKIKSDAITEALERIRGPHTKNN